MDRRSFFATLGFLELSALTHDWLARQGANAMGEGKITDVLGVKVGHFTDARRPTGCTVILTEDGAVGGVDVRGGAPGTRETDLLYPINTVEKVNAIVLSGGSAYGLDTASGVMRYLEERGKGYVVRGQVVPIVPAAILFDLHVGDGKIRPDAESGYKACLAATSGEVEEGNAGAGAGATVGKMLGIRYAMKGGIGTSSIKVKDIVVGALVAVNAAGDIIDHRTGKIIAGARSADGKGFANVIEKLKSDPNLIFSGRGRNTTLGVVATNVRLTKAQAMKVAQMAHVGVARTVVPAHTTADGDTMFALSTGQIALDVDLTVIGALAAEAVSEAVVRAVKKARSISGFPSHSDLVKP